MDKKPLSAARLASSILCGAFGLACPGHSAYAAISRIVSAQVDAPIAAPFGANGAALGASFSNPLGIRSTLLTAGLANSLAPTQAVPVVNERSPAPVSAAAVTPSERSNGAPLAAVPVLNAPAVPAGGIMAQASAKEDEGSAPTAAPSAPSAASRLSAAGQAREILAILDTQRRVDLQNPPSYLPSHYLSQASYRALRRTFLETPDDPMRFKFGTVERLRGEFSKLESDPSLGTIARLFDFVRSPVIMPNGIAHEFFGQKVRTTPLAQLPASWRYHRSYVEFARSTLGRMLGRLSVKEREKIYSALPGLREELASSAR